MTPSELAEQKLVGMLTQAGLPVRPTYCRAEVCLILGVSERTFWRMISAHDLDEKGHPLYSWTLDSFKTRGHHRVRFAELADYLRRNRTYERQHAVDPRQSEMFD